jgi:hypothetical protein
MGKNPGFGNKPSNPQSMPRANGRKPSAPRAHASSGSSSTGSRSMVWIGVGLLAVPLSGALTVVGYLLHGYGVL